MARHLFFAIAFIGMGSLINSSAEATDAARCENAASNCIGRCANPGSGTNDNRCTLRPAGEDMFGTRARRGSRSGHDVSGHHPLNFVKISGSESRLLFQL
jgi:Tfp pilus assembly protein PilW